MGGTNIHVPNSEMQIEKFCDGDTCSV
jgi:hypothetical protein